MMKRKNQAGKTPKPWLLWAAWGSFLVIWTIGLLRPEPVQIANRVFTPWTAFFLSKGLHLGVYFFLTAIVLFLPSGAKAAGPLLSLLAIHAWVTEYFQQWVRFRQGSFRDVVIDWAGILLGYLAGQWLLKKMRAAKRNDLTPPGSGG